MDRRFGVFSGEPETQWLAGWHGEPMMKLMNDFSFTEAKTGRVWQAPKDLVIDGASIPRPLWTFIGSPFTGNYRRALILHGKAYDDYPNDGPQRKTADVMFAVACRAGGCGAFQTKMLYAAVRVRLLWDKYAPPDESNQVWLQLPMEPNEFQKLFLLAGERIQAAHEALLKEEEPEEAVAAVDAVLGDLHLA